MDMGSERFVQSHEQRAVRFYESHTDKIKEKKDHKIFTFQHCLYLGNGTSNQPPAEGKSGFLA
jgi:hypothetical protein